MPLWFPCTETHFGFILFYDQKRSRSSNMIENCYVRYGTAFHGPFAIRPALAAGKMHILGEAKAGWWAAEWRGVLDLCPPLEVSLTSLQGEVKAELVVQRVAWHFSLRIAAVAETGVGIRPVGMSSGYIAGEETCSLEGHEALRLLPGISSSARLFVSSEGEIGIVDPA